MPDGYDIVNQIINIPKGHVLPVNFILEKKEPKYIEVRLCLVARESGVYGIFAHDKRNIRPTGFVKYLEDQWRKVEI